ncbi:uncharacterized protein LOC131673777 [Phymastichus coffea]|uniref:uncharacterized protein LOC131673777 n=1 Tax=Phymastichus coffea TaxID=108790 RepID=UPI00273C0CBE|nr:uncharacterized protein LOC131673777 [Phymastichus coffea]
MKSFALLSLFVVSAFAGEILHEPLVNPLPSFSQEQNTATGEYGYSYHGGPSAKTEFRASDGTTTGTYSYVDAHGLLQTVNYIADEFGFRAAGSNIPSDGVSALDAHLTEQSRQTLNALSQRKKRGIFVEPILAAAPAAHLPVASSHQSRFQIHNGAKIIEEVRSPVIASAHHVPLLFRKKRGIYTAEAPLPPTTAKILDELAPKPVLVHAAPTAVEVRTALPAVATTSYTQHLPVATSSQSRFQLHNGAKIFQQTSLPVFAPIFPAHFAPSFPAHFAPAFPAHPVAPAFPASQAVIADGDSITVESA